MHRCPGRFWLPDRSANARCSFELQTSSADVAKVFTKQPDGRCVIDRRSRFFDFLFINQNFPGENECLRALAGSGEPAIHQQFVETRLQLETSRHENGSPPDAASTLYSADSRNVSLTEGYKSNFPLFHKLFLSSVENFGVRRHCGKSHKQRMFNVTVPVGRSQKKPPNWAAFMENRGNRTLHALLQRRAIRPLLRASSDRYRNWRGRSARLRYLQEPPSSGSSGPPADLRA